MDPELDNIISILNPKSTPISNTQARFRIRNTKPSQSQNRSRQSNSLPPQKSQLQVKQAVATEKSIEIKLEEEEEIAEEVIADINDFYKEEDEEFKKNITGKIGAPVLWMRHFTKREENEAKHETTVSNLMKGKRFLVFRPYIDPMSIQPKLNSQTNYFFRMMHSDVKLIRFTLEDNGFIEAPLSKNNWTIMWHGGPIKMNIYQSLSKYQKVNHFPRSYEITRKDLMYKNLARMQVLYGIKAYDFVPKSFIVPQDAGQLEYEMSNEESVWIVKPSASSQGKGIFLATKFSEIPKSGHVISQYIDNPLLIEGLKFDLRVYVAITCINPLRIYLYKEGLVRFATQKYQGTGKGSRYMYLTNYSVNKFSNNFVENTNALEDGKGSKWSHTALRKLFKKEGIDDIKIWDKIKDIAIKTILSIEGIVSSACEMHVPYRNNCVELLGFDILIDDNLNPWLLEVNLSPSLNCDSPIDQKIKGEMIADLFTLAGVVPTDQRNGGDKANENKALNYAAYMEQFMTLSNKKKNKKAGWNFNNKPISSENLKDIDSREERGIIKETNYEYKRRGNFERIFPSEISINYKNFFERERPYNTLLCNQFGKIHRKGQGGAAVVYRKPPRNPSKAQID